MSRLPTLLCLAAALTLGLLASACDTGPGYVDHDSFEPAVVWTGTEHAVAFRHEAYDGTGIATIQLGRVSAAGKLLGAPLVVSNSPGRAHYPSVGWSGDEYAVAWLQQSEPDRGIYLSRVSADGQLVAGPDYLADVHIQGADELARPTVMWTPSGWLVTWPVPDDDYRLEAALLDADGQRIGEDMEITSAEEGAPRSAVVWAGDEAGVLFTASTSDQESLTRIVRFDTDGTRAADISLGEQVVGNASLAVDGDTYGAAWEGYVDGWRSEIFVAVASRDGSVGTVTQLTDSYSTPTYAIRYVDLGGSSQSEAADVAAGNWRPAIVAMADGTFVVVWTGRASASSNRTVTVAATFGADGSIVEQAREIMAEAAGNSWPLGAGSAGDELVLSWFGEGTVNFATGTIDDMTRWF